jgi:thiamine-phosphate pyrophosphorylase
MLRPLLYYVTDRRAFSGDDIVQRRTLLDKIEEAAQAGIDYIQLREKDLAPRELESFASEAVARIRGARTRVANGKRGTTLLINSRTDVAIAVGANGVHLPANDVSPVDVHRVWNSNRDSLVRLTISLSCHTLEDVCRAETDGADLAVFAPVFGKKDAPTRPPIGLEGLRAACRSRIPLFALGGVTLENATACLEAGAAGIAAIRLFQENNIAQLVSRLRP